MTITGLVFDIQRASFHDGPGIRTTIFLKGCPLRCVWCHNPESRSYQPQISFNQEKCLDCFKCVSACEQNVHQVIDHKHFMVRSLCLACGTCVQSCSNEALRMIGEIWSVEQVMSEAEKDRDYYINSGGGITLSGGEPLGQFDFTKAILEACHDAGIHTCIETSGFAPSDQFIKLLPITDIFLFDYKATGEENHASYVGAPNDLILANFNLLYSRGATMILRCPMIPGMNDTPAHLSAIAGFAQNYPDLKGIELMPYHDLGRGKSLAVGQDFPLNGISTPTKEMKARYLEILKQFGCERAIIG